MTRRTVIVVAAAASVAALLAVSPEAAAKHRKRRRPRPEVVDVETPFGLQGVAGAGSNVLLVFTLADITGTPTDVEVQYAFDLDADGIIYDDEYRPATEDRLDARDTRANAAPQLFPSGSTAGALNAFVWRSAADVSRGRILRLEYAITPQGRLIPDPDNPGSHLFATGPYGGPCCGGVKMRIRTVPQRKKHRRKFYGAWMYTDTFTLDNATAPSMTIDAVAEGPPILVNWTVFDRDSEDFNGNGVLDVANGEDLDGDGILDCERVGVAFDFHSLTAGEDPATMTDAELETLVWHPCTRLAGVGDTDSLDARPGVPFPTSGDLAGVGSAPPGVGRRWVFAWDPARDVGPTTFGVILRGTPFDEQRARGATVYWRTAVQTTP